MPIVVSQPQAQVPVTDAQSPDGRIPATVLEGTAGAFILADYTSLLTQSGYTWPNSLRGDGAAPPPRRRAGAGPGRREHLAVRRDLPRLRRRGDIRPAGRVLGGGPDARRRRDRGDGQGGRPHVGAGRRVHLAGRVDQEPGESGPEQIRRA